MNFTGTMGPCCETTFRCKFLFVYRQLFHNSLEQSITFFFWFFTQRLTPDQKESYKQKAKTQPARTVMVPAKYTSQGVPLEVVEREARELAEKQKYMERKVHSVVEDGFLENGKVMSNKQLIVLLSTNQSIRFSFVLQTSTHAHLCS